jgi:hypothetical protein
LKFSKNVLISELYKGKKFNGKKVPKINALLLSNYKNHLDAKKRTKEMDPKWTFELTVFWST